MPFYGPFQLGEVSRPMAERRLREQVPDISGFTMDMPGNTLGFTSQTPGLFEGTVMPANFGTAETALSQRNPLGVSGRTGLFERAPGPPESITALVGGGESPGPAGPGPQGSTGFGGIAAGPTPTAPSAPSGLSGLAPGFMSGLMGFLGEAQANTPAAKIAQALGFPNNALTNTIANLMVSKSPMAIPNTLLGLGLTAFTPKQVVTERSPEVQFLMQMVDKMGLQLQAPPPQPVFQEEEPQPPPPPPEPEPAPPASEPEAPPGLTAQDVNVAVEAEQGDTGTPGVPGECRLATWAMREAGLTASHPAWQFWNGTLSPAWHAGRTREGLVTHAAYRRLAKRLVPRLDRLDAGQRAQIAADLAQRFIRPFESGDAGLDPETGTRVLLQSAEDLAMDLAIPLPRRWGLSLQVYTSMPRTDGHA